MFAPTFKNEQLEAEISANGYILIPNFLTEPEIKYLRGLYADSHLEEAVTSNIFWNSNSHLSRETGAELSGRLVAAIAPRLDEYFSEWEFPVATFMSKKPTADSYCPAHRDNSIFDERRFQYRNIWIPLRDATEDNGTLFVVPRSHLLFTQPLPMFSDWPYTHLVSRLEREFRPVPARAGDLVVYLDRTIHGSYRNLTQASRPAVHGGLIHKTAEIQYLREVKGANEIEIYNVSRDFFATQQFSDPDFERKYPVADRCRYVAAEITEEDVDRFYS